MPGELVQAQMALQAATLAGLISGATGINPVIVTSHNIAAGAPADVLLCNSVPNIPASGMVVVAAYFFRTGAGTCTLRDTAAGAGNALSGSMDGTYAPNEMALGTATHIHSGEDFYLFRSADTATGVLVIFWKVV
jgi:hypothetical protein